MPIAIKGATSGSVTLTAPAVAGTTTITLPATTSNFITSVSAVPAVTGTPSATTYLRGDGVWDAGTPAGAVMAYAGSTAPDSWLLCSGDAVSRTTYAALFAVIGTTYGSGDGSTTFNLPDMRGRMAAGLDNMGGTAANRITAAASGITGTTLGAAGGVESITLTTSQIPAHTHDVRTGTGSACSGNGRVGFYANGTGTANVAGAALTTGGGGAHANVQPTIMMNYIIKA